MDMKENDEQARNGEIEAIKQVVATVQHAQQNELVEEFVGLFRADAIWTTGGGKRLFERDGRRLPSWHEEGPSDTTKATRPA